MKNEYSNEINKILTFAVISDEFSGKNSYENLIKLINKKDSYKELINQTENSIDEIQELVEYKGIKLEIKEDAQPQKLSENEFEELKKLINNYNSDHFLVNRLKRFMNLRDQNKSELFLDNDRNEISIYVSGDFPLREYPLREEEKNNLRNFFEKYPTLKTFDDFEKDLEKSSKKVAEVYKDFFSHFVLSKGLNEFQVEMLNEECINMQEMNKRIKEKLTVRPHVEEEDIHTIRTNVISAKISDIVKISLEISKDLKNNKSKKNNYK